MLTPFLICCSSHSCSWSLASLWLSVTQNNSQLASCYFSNNTGTWDSTGTVDSMTVVTRDSFSMVRVRKNEVHFCIKPKTITFNFLFNSLLFTVTPGCSESPQEKLWGFIGASFYRLDTLCVTKAIKDSTDPNIKNSSYRLSVCKPRTKSRGIERL